MVIDLQKGRAPALAWFAALTLAQVAIPGFVAMELYQSARDEREAQSADAIIRPLAIVWPSQAACGSALANFRTLHLSHSLGLADALIAATARELAATLCTFNVKHYQAVPGLTTEQPYMR